jgi:hypothetical protein
MSRVRELSERFGRCQIWPEGNGHHTRTHSGEDSATVRSNIQRAKAVTYVLSSGAASTSRRHRRGLCAQADCAEEGTGALRDRRRPAGESPAADHRRRTRDLAGALGFDRPTVPTKVRASPTPLDATIDWLLDGDPAIRWQTLRDLIGAKQSSVERERRRRPTRCSPCATSVCRGAIVRRARRVRCCSTADCSPTAASPTAPGHTGRGAARRA